MTPDVRQVFIDELTRIAPEIDPASVRPGVNVRDQLDLDSMDFLNLMLALHGRLGIEIPEADYPRLTTVDGAAAYLSEKLSAQTQRGTV